MNKNLLRGLAIYGVLVVAVFLVYLIITRSNGLESMSYNNDTLIQDMEEGNVSAVELHQNSEVPTGYILVNFNNGLIRRYYTTDVKDTQEFFEKNGIEYKLADVKRATFMEKIFPYIFVLVLFVIFLMITAGSLASGGSGGSSGVLTFGKSRAKKDIKTGITFNDVAGLDEEKEELEEVVDFLKNPSKYNTMGARIPKGIILEGPPGTGKTLLAKAVSGEADVPFFSISGSDFVEMFVGVGASRVRDLFADAKRNAPCLIFIDEIDAVARHRGSGLGGGHDEREQTLNQLLVEMDGFGSNEGVIVIAATNRVDILDHAILRPGRFDRRIMVGLPDVKGREDILKIHIKNKPIGDDVDIHEIARTTSGFSGADLENLMNEAAIKTAKEDRKYITKSDVDNAFVKIGIGTEKKSRVVSERDRRITAYHEAGHAILFHELEDMGPVYTVSIIPNGSGAGGYTMPLPDGENKYWTKGKLMRQIQTLMGGRIAESLIFDDVTTGASQDIKQATAVAREMIMKYGFSDRLGFLNYEYGEEDEVFIGRDIGHAKVYSDETAAVIDEEVRKLIDDCYAKAKEMLENNIDMLHKTAELLLEKDKITGEELDALFSEA